MANRRTRITIESERVLIVTGDPSAQGRCENCDRNVDFSKPGPAGRVLEAIAARLGELGQDQLRLGPAKNKFTFRLKSMLRFLKEAGNRYKSR